MARILAASDASVGSLDDLSQVTARELAVASVSFALVLGGQHRGSLGVSDSRAAAAEDLQFTLGEGPCIEAGRSGRAVFEPDLATSGRWPSFVPEALALGLVAAFAVPLQVGTARLGALDLYQDRPGPLDSSVVDDACMVADVATLRVLGEQSRVAPGDLPEIISDSLDARAVIHQATGVVAVQLDIDLDDALLAVRARAYAESRSVHAVATDVVDRRIRFDR